MEKCLSKERKHILFVKVSKSSFGRLIIPGSASFLEASLRVIELSYASLLSWTKIGKYMNFWWYFFIWLRFWSCVVFLHLLLLHHHITIFTHLAFEKGVWKKIFLVINSKTTRKWFVGLKDVFEDVSKIPEEVSPRISSKVLLWDSCRNSNWGLSRSSTLSIFSNMQHSSRIPSEISAEGTPEVPPRVTT